MARIAKAPIGSRTERKANKAVLKARAEPYYSQITDGVHLGYRSAFPAAGQWVARKAIKKPDGSPSYTTQVIGTADDILDSEWTDAEVKKKTPGLSATHLVNVFKSSVLTYSQAVILSSAWAGASTTADKNITVDAIADLYIQSLRIEGGKKDSNVKTLESTLNHARAKFGNVKLEALTMDMIEAWRNDLVAATNPDGSRKYAKTTVNRILQIFKACLNYAYSKNKVSSDRAWRGVKQIKPQKGEKVSRKLVLTEDQVDALVDATDEQALKDLIIAGFCTGARYGELVAAKVADLNGSVLMVDGKTGERAMHLSGQAQEHFAKLAKGKKPSDLLLPNPQGNAWNKSIQNRFFRKACVAAGLTKDNGLIEDPVFYTLRHSFATIALDTGTSPSVIAENIGNSEKVLNGFYRKHIKDGATAKLIDFASPRLKVVA